MRRYVNEFVFRLNEANVRKHTMVRLDLIIRNAVGKRLTYEELTRWSSEFYSKCSCGTLESLIILFIVPTGISL